MDRQSLGVLICPRWRTDASTSILVNILDQGLVPPEEEPAEDTGREGDDEVDTDKQINRQIDRQNI